MFVSAGCSVRDYKELLFQNFNFESTRARLKSGPHIGGRGTWIRKTGSFYASDQRVRTEHPAADKSQPEAKPTDVIAIIFINFLKEQCSWLSTDMYLPPQHDNSDRP